jgi:hypothetical protein
MGTCWCAVRGRRPDRSCTACSIPATSRSTSSRYNRPPAIWPPVTSNSVTRASRRPARRCGCPTSAIRSRSCHRPGPAGRSRRRSRGSPRAWPPSWRASGPPAAPISGSARVSHEQAKSQKVTLSGAPVRPDRVVHSDGEGQRTADPRRTVTGVRALVLGTSRCQVAHQGRLPEPAASAGSPRGWLVPSPRRPGAQGRPPSAG